MPTALKLAPADATIFLSVNNLWAGSSLVVFAISPPPPHKRDPVVTELSHVDDDTASTDGIDIPTNNSKTDLACSGLRFAVEATADTITGTITIGIMRDQDTPQTAPFDRPTAQTVKLSRKAGDDLYVQSDIGVAKDA